MDLINCTTEGIFEDCYFINTEITNSQLSKCKLKHSDSINTKLLNCNVDNSTLTNCYFVEGYLNGDMYGGVYRSGKLGPYATMDSNVKLINDFNNFFDTKFDTEEKADKGMNKAFGKGKII
jgi:hypothetical protein